MTASAFVTETGVRVPAITTDQMREVDRVAIEEVGPNLFQMMENAGRGLAELALDTLGASWRSAPIVVLSGTGGNGGGGICAARHLANRGAHVSVVVSDVSKLTPVPKAQLDVYRGTPGELAAVSVLARLEPGLILDSVIGYSLRGSPAGVPLEMIEWVRTRACPILSLDVPSGIDATSGHAPGAHVDATATLSLALPKTGLDAAAVGDLYLADLGIPAEVYRRLGIEVPSALFEDRFRMALRPFGV